MCSGGGYTIGPSGSHDCDCIGERIQAAEAARLVTISEGELACLREAAAYASFARPILEGLGDRNPLSEL